MVHGDVSTRIHAICNTICSNQASVHGDVCPNRYLGGRIAQDNLKAHKAKVLRADLHGTRVTASHKQRAVQHSQPTKPKFLALAGFPGNGWVVDPTLMGQRPGPL
jgi:hypothetical protein